MEKDSISIEGNIVGDKGQLTIKVNGKPKGAENFAAFIQKMFDGKFDVSVTGRPPCDFGNRTTSDGIHLHDRT